MIRFTAEERGVGGVDLLRNCLYGSGQVLAQSGVYTGTYRHSLRAPAGHRYLFIVIKNIIRRYQLVVHLGSGGHSSELILVDFSEDEVSSIHLEAGRNKKQAETCPLSSCNI